MEEFWPLMIMIGIDYAHVGSLSSNWISCDLDRYFVDNSEYREKSGEGQTKK